jgi:hypothetical protein
MHIEKDIPIPQEGRRMDQELRETSDAMRAGDSVLFENEKEALAVRRRIYQIGGKAVIRKVNGIGWRVWKV